jgi:hypothetical protein
MKPRAKREFKEKRKIRDSDLKERANNLISSLNKGENSAENYRIKILEVARELEAQSDLAGFFFEEIATRPQSEIIEPVLELHKAIQGKAVRKMLKRVFYQLQQRGIDIPFEESAQDSRGILREVVLATALGYTSGFDGTGGRMVALLIPKLQGGRILLVSLINGAGGLEDLRVMETSKKEARQVIGDLEGGAGERFLEAEAGQLTFLIKEAYGRNSKPDRESEKVYETVMNYISRTGEIREEPIIREIFSAEKVPEGWFPDLNRMSSIPEFHFFLFNEDRLKGWREEITRLQGSVLVLSEVQKREQMQDVLRKAVEDLTQNGEQERLRRYLEEVAYLYHLKGQAEEAKVLYLGAASLDEEADQEAGKTSPLLAWLAEKALMPVDMAEGAIQEPAEKRTEAGIILPSWVK